MQPQYNEGAGKRLRREAQQFRTKALYRYSAATGLVVLPLLVYAVAPFDPLFLCRSFLLIWALRALRLIEGGKKFWKASQRYDRGACGEEKIQKFWSP